ncbi:hypothetical protein LCGC14_1655500 [marine sediment metagenome]|uniref:Uncharacterized protein n=1 Tax=marine sediment metagenome TaxID=412755 RepID=A0A0F9KBE6_9ZZZZ
MTEVELNDFVATHKRTCNGRCPACQLIVEIERLKTKISSVIEMVEEY